MLRSWPAMALIAGAAVSVASLYLPWQSCSSECATTNPEFVGFGFFAVDGWDVEAGQPMALSAVLLAVMAACCLVRPQMMERLPVGVSAVLVSYLAVAVAVGTRDSADQQEVQFHGSFGFTYGAYVGIAAALSILAVAVVLRRRELWRRPGTTAALLSVPAAGLSVAYLLPWFMFPASADFEYAGVAVPPAIIGAAGTLWMLLLCWSTDGAARLARGVLAAIVLLFTVAAMTAAASFGYAYGAWVGLGLAITLAVMAGIAAVPFPRLSLRWRAIATTAGVGLLLVSLFLPWYATCYADVKYLAPYAGDCYSTRGWHVAGSVGAALALALVMPGQRLRSRLSAVEIVGGLGLLIATQVIALTGPFEDVPDVSLETRIGPVIASVAAAILVVLTIASLHRPALERTRVLARLVPIAVCVAYLVIVVVAWWDVLPDALQSHLWIMGPSWISIAGVLVCLRLLGSWVRPVVGVQENVDWLLLLPIVLTALAAIEVIPVRDVAITWGGGVVLGLSLLLVLLGWIERREGLESFRIPEVLRFDRL